MPKRIAILGGGMASLSAALTLTDSPEWQHDYDITLYQVGWRLGGKTTTGRGPYDRIEEHGIHILQGWYHTTFRLLRAVYAERAQRGLDPDSPLQDLFADGLRRNDTTLITEYDKQNDKWTSWPLILPRTEELPGETPPHPTWEVLQKGLAMVLEFALGSPYRTDIPKWEKKLLDHFFPVDGKTAPGCLGSLGKVFGTRAAPPSSPMKDLRAAQQHLHERPDPHAPRHHHHRHHRRTHSLFGNFIHELEDALVESLPVGSRLRRAVEGMALAYYISKGILEDVYDPQTHTFDYAAVDEYDFRQWLSDLGAADWLTGSAIVRFFYTGTFANLVNDHGGALSACTALQFLTNGLSYQGSFVFQFLNGTGDTMVLPIYQVLRARGVKFRFFNRVEQLNTDGAGNISSVDLTEQVSLTVPEYQPTIKLADGLSAWPDRPIYDQIDPDQARELQEGKVDLEDPWAQWAGRKYSLSVGEDFDEVVLGIPVACLSKLCAPLIAENEKWQRMVDGIKTQPTQSAQFWFRPDLVEMGMRAEDWELPEVDAAANVVLYENPMYSWLDSSLVIPHENWPEGKAPGFLAYYTGPYVLGQQLPRGTDKGFQQQMDEQMKTAFNTWLQLNMGWFWPKAAPPENPKGLDYSLLWAPEAQTTPAEKLDWQFFRNNVRPTDQYTLSVPGSGAFRLKTDESGYANLFLCGDWIDFGANVGYIDGTIQSGQQAAAAILERFSGIPSPS